MQTEAKEERTEALEERTSVRSSGLCSSFFAIVKATALEIACDPLALLITASALALSTLAGALHYHQFGEPARMAREAGLSSILIGGLAFAVFSTVRTLRREIESGTLQMALAHSVSRGEFLAAKLTGATAAFMVFFITLSANSLTAIRGSEIGATVANGDIARVWGPSLALGISALVLPPAVAAGLNRFANFRFVRSATILMLVVSLVGAAYRFDPALAARHFGAFILLLPPIVFFIAFSGAAAVRLAGNAAVSVTFALVALSLPVLGAFYLPEALAKGGTIPFSYIALAFAAMTPLTAAATLAGMEIFRGRDIA